MTSQSPPNETHTGQETCGLKYERIYLRLVRRARLVTAFLLQALSEINCMARVDVLVAMTLRLWYKLSVWEISNTAHWAHI